MIIYSKSGIKEKAYSICPNCERGAQSFTAKAKCQYKEQAEPAVKMDLG